MPQRTGPRLTDVSPAFRVLAEESRLAIMDALRGCELSVGALARRTGLHRSLVSHHLTALTEAGLARVRRDPEDRRRTLVSLDPAGWQRLAEGVNGFARDACGGPPGEGPGPLAAQPYFAALSREELRTMAAALRGERYGAGQVVLREGDPCPGLYVVAEGRVKVYAAAADGAEQVPWVARPGDSFNEVAAFDGGPNTASAVALQPTLVYVLPVEQVQQLLRTSPGFSAGVARLFAARLRRVRSPRRPVESAVGGG
ncbi:MAG TPA: cyclic nucleotide-binding domain-containing protein [Dehalococcoidia bacterium]